MKPTESFKLSKSTKRVLATLDGESKHLYKGMMIAAQIAEEENKKKPLKREKDSDDV